MRWLKGFLTTALLCVAVNFVIVPAQNWWHREDRDRIERMKPELDAERDRISQMESKLRDIADRLKFANLSDSITSGFYMPRPEIITLQGEILQLESAYPNGLPPRVYRRYTQLIAHHNRLVKSENAKIAEMNRKERVRVALLNRLKNQYNDLYPKYSEAVGKFNKQAAEYNASAKRAGSTWFLIPVPGSGRGYAEETSAASSRSFSRPAVVNE